MTAAGWGQNLKPLRGHGGDEDNKHRSSHSGLKAPELVMDAGCRDNR